MIDKITPQKLDSSLDLKLTKKNSMVDALNVMITESEFTGSVNEGGDGSGDAGVLRNVKGNQRANYRFPWDAINKVGTTKVIGSVVDDKTKIVYFFLWSSIAAEQGVYAYDLYGKLPHGQPNTIRLIYKGNNLGFRQNDFVKADVVHINRPTLDLYARPTVGTNAKDEFSTDAIIYFTDNRNEPRKINAYRNLLASYYLINDTFQLFGGENTAQWSAAVAELTNFSSSQELYSDIVSYYDPERRKLISACTTVPLFPITNVSFQNDSDYTGSNFKSTAGLQFAYQIVYKDGNESAISPYSKIFVPPVIIGQGANTIVNYSENNKCVIELPSIFDRECETIKILVREGENSSFLVIDEVKRNEDSTNWDQATKRYSFYNDKVLTGVSEEEVNKTYDAVPKKAQAQTVEENRLIYGNYVEGFGNVKASAEIQPIYSEVNQPILKQVKVVPNMSPLFGEDESTIGSPLSAGFILDFREIDYLGTNDTVTFNMSIAPDRNFHVGNWSRVAPTNYNLTVDTYIDESDPYTLFSFYDESQVSANRRQATNIWGTLPARDINNTYLVYSNRFDENNNSNEHITPLVGSGYLNPIIIKGGTLSFSVSFTYTGGPLSNTAASDYLGTTIRQLLTGSSTNQFVSDPQVSNTYTHSYDLGLNDFDTLQAGYPNIGLRAGQNPSSTVYPQSSAPDYRTFLISSIGHPDAYYDADEATSWGVPPIGYFILNKAKAKFSLKKGNTTSSSSVQEVKLNLDRLYDLDFATCIRRPSMFAPWVVLTSDFWTGNDYNDWTTYRTNSVVEPSSGDFWDIGDYDFNEDELGSVIGEDGIFPRAGEYYKNFTKQFGYLNFQSDTTEINTTNFYIYDGEAGAGGYNGTDEFNAAEISKCGTVPMYIGFVDDGGRVSYYLPGQSTSPTYKYFIGGTFFSGKPSMVGYNIAQNHYLIINGPDAGAENQLSFAPAMKGPASITPAAAQTNDRSLLYYSVNDYDIGLLHPDIEVLTSNFMASSYDEPYKSFKSSSKHDFGVVYFDRYGRHGFVNPIGSVYALGYSDQERSNKGKISMRFSMATNPPSWATHWKIVHSKSVTVDRFIQYSVGGAYVKVGEAEEDNERNIYVSLNYLQGSNVSYVSSFGARTPEGGLNMYNYEKGDRLRIISYQNSSGELVYPTNHDFEVIDMVKLGDTQNPLYEADSSADQWLQGDFVVLRNNFNYQSFDYVSIKNGGHFWGNNCIVELYKPSKNTDGSKRFYYEIGDTFEVYSDLSLTNQSQTPSPFLRHGGLKTITDGDVYWRPVAVNFRNIDNGSFTDIIVNTEDDAGVNLSKSNFKSHFLESMTSTDLLRGDAVGLGRVHTVFKDATESRRMASLTYSLPTNPLSKRNYYGSFNGSTLNFKDLPEKYGYINYIMNRGDSIVVFQDDKVSVVPMNRSIIEQTDGASLAVSASDVLGKARFYAGAVGTDGHPESVVQAEESIYFVHASSGRVLRFTESGITDVTNYGMLSRIREELRRVEGTDSLKIVSGYDPLNEEYLLTIKSQTNIASDVFIDQDDVDITLIAGCTDPIACNYNQNAEITDGSCSYPTAPYDCDGNCINDTDGDGVCDELEIVDCTDPLAWNFNTDATDTNNSLCIYAGCMSQGACNYDADASVDDGSCEFSTCAGCTDPDAYNYDNTATISTNTCIYLGCTDPTACNYDPSANQDDNSCTYAIQYYDCDGNCLNDSDNDGVCDELELPGCTDPNACNYNPQYTDDDGSCIYAEEYYDCYGNCLNDENGDGICDELSVYGCTIAQSSNYNPDANVNDDSCIYTIYQCDDPLACNYGGAAPQPSQGPSGLVTYVTEDDGSCVFASGPCDVCVESGGSWTVVTYDADGDGTCDDEEVYGCTIVSACNYDPLATENNGSCEFSTCAGCMDADACNFDPDATIQNDNLCEYPIKEWLDCDGNCLNDSDGDGVCDEEEIPGCTSVSACNYNPLATEDDGSCVFPGNCRICDGFGGITTNPSCCPQGPIQDIDDYIDRYGLTGFDLISVYAYLIGTFAENNDAFVFSSYTSVFDLNSDGSIEVSDLLSFFQVYGSFNIDLNNPQTIQEVLRSHIVLPTYTEEFECYVLPAPDSVGCFLFRASRVAQNSSFGFSPANFDYIGQEPSQGNFNFNSQLAVVLAKILASISGSYPGSATNTESTAYTTAWNLIYQEQSQSRPPSHIVRHIIDFEIAHEQILYDIVRRNFSSLLFLMGIHELFAGYSSSGTIGSGSSVLLKFLGQYGDTTEELNIGFLAEYSSDCNDFLDA